MFQPAVPTIDQVDDEDVAGVRQTTKHSACGFNDGAYIGQYPLLVFIAVSPERNVVWNAIHLERQHAVRATLER